MAVPTVASGTKLLIKLGDGASPEVFGEPCGLTTKNVTFSKTVNDLDLPDCADPDAISWVAREAQNRSMEISGDGVLDTTVLATWQDWFDSNDATNCQVAVNVATGVGGGHWAGAFHLTSLGIGGERGQKMTISVTMQSDGAVTWVPAT